MAPATFTEPTEKISEIMQKNKSTTTPYVNNTIDKIIKLSEVEAFVRASRNVALRHNVRVMTIYNMSTGAGQTPKDTVGTLKIIADWSRTQNRSGEFSRLIVSLVLLAEGKAADAPHRLEKTKLDEDIWEIKDPGQRLRLFAFIDNNQVIVIAEHYQKHGRPPSEERRLQDRAIRNAMARRDLYMNARLDSPDLYIVEK